VPVLFFVGEHCSRRLPRADALEIGAGAKRRLADEYDAAQERGEVVGRKGGRRTLTDDKGSSKDVGLSYEQIHEARAVRDGYQLYRGTPAVARHNIS
jgi:hypothetical protein